MGDAVYIAESHSVAATYGAGAESHALDEDVGAAVYMRSLISVGRAAYASSEDADVGLVLDGESAFDI